ncbi:MAG TPA: hypothetical protein VGP76_21975 [Planctomycetaceae bacterium]|jgi:hypothetical protein|nr:hypothetical protein [Planctomycetaceae bacterium]
MNLSRPVGAEVGTGHAPAGRDIVTGLTGRDTLAREVGQLRGTTICPTLMSIYESTSEKRAVGRDTFVDGIMHALKRMLGGTVQETRPESMRPQAKPKSCKKPLE